VDSVLVSAGSFSAIAVLSRKPKGKCGFIACFCWQFFNYCDIELETNTNRSKADYANKKIKGEKMMIDTSLIPSNLVDALERYVKNRMPTGSFLRAVLENNLVEAVGRADSDNIRLLPEIVQYCYNNLPHNCWGSPEIVKRFLDFEVR